VTGAAPDAFEQGIERAAKLTGFLTDAINELKGQEPEPMAALPPNIPADPVRKNITGASFLGAKFKADLAAAKAEIEAAQSQMGDAVADVKAAAVKTVEMAKAIKAEADDLKASLGQGSNE
jgi:hypothetical protein